MASGGSTGRDPYDEEAGGRRPFELDGRDAATAASSSDHRPGNVMPRYQVGSTKGDTSNRLVEGPQQPSTDDVRKSKTGSRYYTAFGVDLSPDNMAVAIVYFVQGVLGLARLAVSFYLKDDLHLDPAETAVVSGFSSLPWLIKPLYGFIRSDETLCNHLFLVCVVDSMVVERARGESQSTSGSLQSLCWGSSAFGGIVSAYFSGSLVDTYGVSSCK
nr:unnamed protein product [Digitaria exilis]